MKISTKLGLTMVAIMLGVVGLGTQASAKSATVKIGNNQVPRDYLYTSTFYRSTKAVTVKVTANHTDGTFASKTVRIPKNTVVSGQKYHKPQHRAGFSDDDMPGVYYSLYKLGSQTYFTPVADDTAY